MRYNDKSSAKHNLDEFLLTAHAKQIKELNGTTAMARVNMIKSIVSDRRQPHSPLDNVNTPYNSVRLLKGSPPGQEAVNHYISELSIEKAHKNKYETKQRQHLAMLEACDDEYNYHHKLFGDVAVDRNMEFYNPQLVRDYVNQIRRVWGWDVKTTIGFPANICARSLAADQMINLIGTKTTGMNFYNTHFKIAN